jgi:hypothetical protein
MDYQGQTNQQGTNQPFFTEGVGNQSVEYTDAPENDINLSNATPWGNAAANPTRNQNQSLGNNAINGQLVEKPATTNFEAYAPAPEVGPNFGPMPEMLQITETEPTPVAKTDVTAETSFDESVIKVEGDHLNSKAIDVIDDMEKNLKKTGDAASFVNDFEKAKIANLKNSYNRIFGES